MKEVILTEEELRVKCSEWQKILRLQDWIIKVDVSRGRNMLLGVVGGECEWQLSTKMASIRILDPIDYPDDLMEPQNMERVLVHELLHLHFAALTTDENTVNVEQAVEAISRGLIALQRNGTSKTFEIKNGEHCEFRAPGTKVEAFGPGKVTLFFD